MRHTVIAAATLIVTLGAFNAFGEAHTSQEPVAKIKQVDAANYRGVAEITATSESSVVAGQRLIATAKDGRQCAMSVTSVKDKLAQLDLSSCAIADQLAAGTPLEASLIEMPAEKKPEVFSEPVLEDNNYKIFAKVYASGATTIRSENVKDTAANIQTTGSMQWNANAAWGLSAELYYAPKNHWGFDGGIEVDSARQINSVTGISGTTNYTDKPKFSTGDVYGNIIYRWDGFYVPFGLNVSYISYTPPTGTTSTDSFSGGMGIQFGIGYFVARNFQLELEERMLAYRGTYTTATSTGDYGYMSLSGLQLNIKYGWDL